MSILTTLICRAFNRSIVLPLTICCSNISLLDEEEEEEDISIRRKTDFLLNLLLFFLIITTYSFSQKNYHLLNFTFTPREIWIEVKGKRL